jgi:pimeloyl-ACP methyl ester carboxylesterase/class 3 adenylate cyclase
MSQPATQYARAGDVNIAYQVVGDGPVDLVWVYGLAGNVEVFWEEPSLAAFFRRLAEFSRLIIFDRRGCGLSDRGGGLTTPTLEERVDDVLAVLDTVGSARASILGVSEGAGVAALFASTHPDRAASVVLYGPICRLAGLEHPMGWHDEDVLRRFNAAVAEGWGSDDAATATGVPLWAPSATGDPDFARWLGRYMRQSVSRNEIAPLLTTIWGYDLADVFPAVRVPTLVLGRRDDRMAPSSYARRISAMVPDARIVQLDGIDHLPFAGDFDALAAEIEEFLVGPRAHAARQRRLLTLVFTEIGQSTARLVERGDEVWRELLTAHHDDVRRHLARFGGDEVKHLGDGFRAAFDGPARAIRCALGIADAAERRGLVLRIGVHTGECEVVDGDLRGIAIHVGARLVECADPGEIVVSSTVRDLVAGSGIRFSEGREVVLAGVDGQRTVFPVVRHGATPEVARRLAAEQANVFHRDGEYWTVGYRGLVVTLRDSKGLHDLARLLADPGREHHALDLMSEGVDSRSISSAAAVDAGLAMEGGGAPAIDATARAQYKERISDLEAEIEDSLDRGDPDAAAITQEELDILVAELTAAYGLGGRPRRSPDHLERARKAVRRRLRTAMARVARAHPGLGRHLDASIRTGTFCSYQPERETLWSVDTGSS